MTISMIMGDSVYTKVLFIAAALFVCGELLVTLFAIFYQEFWYKKVLTSRYPKTYTPKISIIVPCKGIPKNLGKNLEGFLHLDYKNYEVIYVTETESDSAVPVIQSIIAGRDDARLVYAGLATKCAQKNYNLIAGVNVTKDSEVLVFADSDIKPAKHWLHALILPLSDPKVAVTSGFRWLHATNNSLGEHSHAYVNIFMYVLFSAASFVGGVGLWGGSMAIRRKEFDSFGVNEKWLRSGVDDMSLSQLVTKNRRKGVVVPASITHTDDLLPTAMSTMAWFERQCMFLKAHFKALWFFGAIPICLIGSILLITLPVAAVLSLTTSLSFTSLGGMASALFYIGEFSAVLLYPLLGPMPRFGTFLFYVPFSRFVHAVGFLRTLFTNVIIWAGVRYYLTFSGNVSRVERGSPKVETK